MHPWIAVGISSGALLVSLYSWYHSVKHRKYDTADRILTDILKLYLEYPLYRDVDQCEKALTDTNQENKLRYDAFATIVWNYLETLFHKYGKGLKRSPFYHAMRDLGIRNKRWLLTGERIHDYDRGLIDFLRVD